MSCWFFLVSSHQVQASNFGWSKAVRILHTVCKVQSDRSTRFPTKEFSSIIEKIVVKTGRRSKDLARHEPTMDRRNKIFSFVSCRELPLFALTPFENDTLIRANDSNLLFTGKNDKEKPILTLVLDQNLSSCWFFLVVGVRRSCQFDLDRYEIFAPLQPGCGSVNLTRNNYLAFDYFHFDRQTCLCDEDNCIIGEARKMKAKDSKGNNANARSKAVFSTLLLVLVASISGAV